MIGRLIAAAAIYAALVAGACAQTTPLSSTPKSKSIASGLTFQLLADSANRRVIEIENNNTTSTENCWVLVGGPWQAGDTTASVRSIDGASITASKDAWLLQPGGSFTRYYPYIPSDPILVTCTNAGDSVAARIQ